MKVVSRQCLLWLLFASFCGAINGHASEKSMYLECETVVPILNVNGVQAKTFVAVKEAHILITSGFHSFSAGAILWGLPLRYWVMDKYTSPFGFQGVLMWTEGNHLSASIDPSFKSIKIKFSGQQDWDSQLSCKSATKERVRALMEDSANKIEVVFSVEGQAEPARSEKTTKKLSKYDIDFHAKYLKDGIKRDYNDYKPRCDIKELQEERDATLDFKVTDEATLSTLNAAVIAYKEHARYASIDRCDLFVAAEGGF